MGLEAGVKGPTQLEGNQAKAGNEDAHLQELRQAIDRAAHLLPAQGPIPIFIHHNTLHAFEHLNFTDAVEKAATIFGCQPYLAVNRYREKLKRGRIHMDDLEAVLREDLADRADLKLADLCTRFELRLAMLQYPIRFGPTEELRWFVAETDALRRVRADAPAVARARLLADSSWEAFTLQALWRVCVERVATVADLSIPFSPYLRHRDLLLKATGVDADLLVHDLLIPFAAAYLDQGLSHWRLPSRVRGFYQAFLGLYSRGSGPSARWLAGLRKELRRLQRESVSPIESISESLQALGVSKNEWDNFLSATLLALRGWGGIIQFLGERPDRAVRPVKPGSLIEFLAVRLILDQFAIAFVARDTMKGSGAIESLRAELSKRNQPPAKPSVEQRAFLIFQIAQVQGWTPEVLSALADEGWSQLVHEIEAFTAMERRRIFHLAFERHFYQRTLDALALRPTVPKERPSVPRFQAMFCIDERQESIRRHLEELAPDVVTFGLAGFYFLDMYYRGVDDAHFAPLCPVMIRPGHWVAENVVESRQETHKQWVRTRRVLGSASHQLHVGTRTFALGAIVSAAVGVLASVPLVARTLFPRLTARFRAACGQFILTLPQTRLQLERSEPTPGPDNGCIGFTLDEMLIIAERVLRDTGLTSHFARLVFTFGHGSTSMNNPHESAYDCGACGGTKGGANGRAIAQMLNDPRVREHLSKLGLHIPADTVFIGGLHNTSSDTVTFYDLDLLPESHRAEFETAREQIEQACNRNSHERCRRFYSAPFELSFEEARQHVEGRAEDLAQVRPEMGHATNAICIVGRRQRTRGLFLDRRAFLNSYDPTEDDAEATILTRILQAAVPVCAGINLEYYFSYVDNPGYGCGNKLPHNITALLGVMDGAASDLRTGLPWQMVEIHEPFRILFIVESTPQTMLRIMDRNPYIGNLIRKGWIQLATLSPHATAIQWFRDSAFHDYHPRLERLPQAPSSLDWYRGCRDHLEFAEIGR